MKEKNLKAETPSKGRIWHLGSGIIMILLGMYIGFNPVAGLLGIALYIGIALGVIGIGYFLAAFAYQSPWFLVLGLFDMAVGVILVSNLGVTATSLPIIFALWCMAVGIILGVNSWNLKKSELPWKGSLLVGLLGIIFAFTMLAYPRIGAVTITTMLGIYVVFYGLFVVWEYYSINRSKQPQ